MRTAPNISNLLRHIDKVITKEFIPAVTGGAKCSENERMQLGEFVTIQHSQVRNITATLLNETCNDVQVEPQLQTLPGEYLDAKTAKKHENARLDISGRGFWCSGEKALFDIRVFNPKASRYRNTPLSKCYTINENEKKKQYNKR